MLKQEIYPNCQGNLFLNKQTIQSSRHQTKILTEFEEDRPFLGLYRSFSEIDLIEIKRLNELIKNKQTIANVGLTHLCAVIKGHTGLSLFSEDIGLMK